MNQMNHFLASHAESVLFLAIFAEQLGVPLPAAPLLVAAGALAAQGVVNPATALGATIAACLVADLIWFYVGRRGGNGLLRLLCRLSLCDASWFGRAECLFARYGMSAVTAAKFVPGLSVLLPPLAGALRVGVGRFVGFDTLGSLLYGIFYLELGVLFSHEVSGLLEWMSRFGTASAGLALFVLMILAACKYAQKRKASGPILEPAAKDLLTAPGT
jgi:membrane protein DedA with SNARE-associated domain